MRSLGLLFVLWCSCADTVVGQDATANSLSQQLIAEDPQKLAIDARKQGNAVQGAILFAQKKLNCVACHAQGEIDLLGPDLTQVGSDVPDSHFVNAILRPSEVIKKGFESSTILTVSGQVVAGRIIKDGEDVVVLRIASDPGRSIEIATSEIEQRQPNVKSTMPESLADQLENRQQFLDLIKYLMDIAVSGNSPDANGQGVTSNYLASGKQVAAEIQGLALLNQFNCVACHDSAVDSAVGGPQAKLAVAAPVLSSVAARVSPEYLQRYIANPLEVKPGSSMPDMMAGLDLETKTKKATAITHYLLSLVPEPFKRQPVDSKAAARGRDSFHTVGCIACHSPRDDDGEETLASSSVPLGDLSPKYNLNGLAAFLENPHQVRPSGRMPNMVLTHWEAIEIASYLLLDSNTNAAAANGNAFANIDAQQVALGSRYFNELQCVLCHELSQNQPEHDPPALDLQALDLPALTHVDVTKGCLSNQPGSWPKFQWDVSQRSAMIAAIEQLAEPLSEPQQIELAMQSYRCFQCHQRDGIGGVVDSRVDFFRTTNENLGTQGSIPPTLTGVGGKLQSKWMREVLVSGRAIRPYLLTRMPQFGADHVGHLVDLFQKVDPVPEETFGTVGDVQETQKIGTEMVGSTGLNCIACHTFQLKPAQTMPAVDLTEMAERLHKGWFFRYMRSPQSLSPSTVMPSFWPGGKAIRNDFLDGDTNEQIEAIWQYLLDGRQARTPRGLQLEPIQLVSSDGKAVMLRRSYPGIGKRGIGVGYPEEVNLAFDAEQMRLGLIWKGPFADPSGVWRSQGHGNVRPLSRDMIAFEAGPELDQQASPWVPDGGRPPNHHFKGYFLDDAMRPTFNYLFENVTVEDYCVGIVDPVSGESGLRRTIMFTSPEPREGLVFRAGTAETVATISDDTFQLGSSLRIRIDEAHAGQVQPSTAPSTGKQLMIPLSIPAGQSTLVLDYILTGDR